MRIRLIDVLIGLAVGGSAAWGVAKYVAPHLGVTGPFGVALALGAGVGGFFAAYGGAKSTR